MGELIFLASPYTSKDKRIQESRAMQAALAAGLLLHQGFNVFSPIAHGHLISASSGFGTDWQRWRAVNSAILAHCEALWVLMLEGWGHSSGVREEIDFALHHDIPIRYLDPQIYTLKEDAGINPNEFRS